MIVIIGNKRDLPKEERRVSFARGREFAEKRGFLFFETSALESPATINDMFQILIQKIVDQKLEQTIKHF